MRMSIIGTSSERASTSWQFYTNSEDAWSAMYEACLRAKNSIDFEQFIFQDDVIGKRFAELFLKKRAEGVRVRLLCDTIGSYFFYLSSLADELRAAGVEVSFFNEIKPWAIFSVNKWFSRDHRKLLVIDQSIAFLGGVGIDDRFKSWRDTQVRFVGQVVFELQQAFDHMWWVAGREKFIRFKEARQTEDGFTVLTNAPHFRQRHINRTVLDAIRSAKHSVCITTPYFVPDARFSRVLRLAARRGVEVRILLPYISNHPYVDFASHYYFARLLKVGGRIFEYRGENGTQMIHAKTITIDEDWSAIGSANIDNLSTFFNYEIMVVSHSRKFSEEIRRQFSADLEFAEEILSEKWGRRSILQRAFELACIPFASFF
jgi:cardiolipin synthase